MEFDRYARYWISFSARPRLAKRTADDYEFLLEKYAIPFLGAKPIDRLQIIDLQTLVNRLTNDNLSSTTVRAVKTVVSAALRQAVEWELIKTNPFRNLILPKKVRLNEILIFDKESSRRFIEACHQHPDGIILAFALETGMRLEEYLALQWSDVDTSAKCGSIRRAVSAHKKAAGLLLSKRKQKSRAEPFCYLKIYATGLKRIAKK